MKIMEFNDLHLGIFVVPIHVKYEDMVSEALQDLESGVERYHAYAMPHMNVHGGTSLMVDGLMDLSTFMVDNVNDIAWQTIGRFFRAHSSLHEGKVLTLLQQETSSPFSIARTSSRRVEWRCLALWRSTCSRRRN